MAFTRIHHVGLVTGDLEQARHVLCDGFGLSIDGHRTPWPEGRPGYDGTTVLEFPVGEVCYEVARPNDTESGAAQFLASTNGRGGMYYISFASDDIAADVRGLVGRGIRLKGEWDGQGPVFLDPATCLGLLLQITPDEHYFVHPYYRGNGTVTGLAHVGLASRDPEESRRFWGEVFGLREDETEERGRTGPDPNRQREAQAANDPVHILEYPVGGTVIEISHPTTSDSGTARLVAQRALLGSVFHHTAPFAPDVHRFVEQAVPAGLQQIGSIPPRGEAQRVTAWFHPRTCLGMLVEPWNRPPGEEHYSHHHPAH